MFVVFLELVPLFCVLVIFAFIVVFCCVLTCLIVVLFSFLFVSFRVDCIAHGCFVYFAMFGGWVSWLIVLFGSFFCLLSLVCCDIGLSVVFVLIA